MTKPSPFEAVSWRTECCVVPLADSTVSAVTAGKVALVRNDDADPVVSYEYTPGAAGASPAPRAAGAARVATAPALAPPGRGATPAGGADPLVDPGAAIPGAG